MGMNEHEAVIARVLDAWADGDADAFVAPYAEDATATLPGGFLPSREAIRQNMKEMFAGPLKDTRMRNEYVRTRQLGPDAAVVNSRSTIEPGDGSWSRETWTLVRMDGRWLVAAYQSSPQVVSGA